MCPKLLVVLVSAGMVVGLCAALAPATIINPNDDTYIDRQNLDTTPNDTFVCTQSKPGAQANGKGRAYKQTFMEFTLGTALAASATFKIVCQTAFVGLDGVVYGKQFQFDGAGKPDPITWRKKWGPWTAFDPDTINPFTQVDTGWTDLGALIGNNILLYNLGSTTGEHTFDLTAFYNAHRGQTITIAFWGTNPINDNAVKWYSSRNTAGQHAPQIDWTPVPEPATLTVLSLLTMAMLRRRSR